MSHKVKKKLQILLLVSNQYQIDSGKIGKKKKKVLLEEGHLILPAKNSDVPLMSWVFPLSLGYPRLWKAISWLALCVAGSGGVLITVYSLKLLYFARRAMDQNKGFL